MVSAEDAIGICRALASHGMDVWLTGGWGIDALLRQQTRPHKDLDLIAVADDVVRLCGRLSRDGYHLKELWPENIWAIDSRGVEIPTAFVLTDAEGRELDVHAVRFDEEGNGIPAWSNEEGLMLGNEDLAGEGAIAGHPVRCITPALQVRCHMGYNLPAVQASDLDRLREKFGVGFPSEPSRDASFLEG